MPVITIIIPLGGFRCCSCCCSASGEGRGAGRGRARVTRRLKRRIGDAAVDLGEVRLRFPYSCELRSARQHGSVYSGLAWSHRGTVCSVRLRLHCSVGMRQWEESTERDFFFFFFDCQRAVVAVAPTTKSATTCFFINPVKLETAVLYSLILCRQKKRF